MTALGRYLAFAVLYGLLLALVFTGLCLWVGRGWAALSLAAGLLACLPIGWYWGESE